MADVAPGVRVFRLPGLTWVPVLFLWVGAIPLAFTTSSAQGAAAHVGYGALVLVIPVVVTVFVARTATVVNAAGMLVRAPFGRRVLPWDEVRGLSVTGRAVYAVVRDGAIRLPCVRVSMLSEVARASGGRLPEIADPVVKLPPTRRRRR
ncbi:PH domain-containing protein [uncultured Jatrophihabitans sp.]|uniref:PH domain-containing protein n=1 Tax=uncultured Jatrophihabitans sp. TaxID=1610747 RepID=UPI0035C95F64